MPRPFRRPTATCSRSWSQEPRESGPGSIYPWPRRRRAQIRRFSNFGGGGWRADLFGNLAPLPISMTTPNADAIAAVIPPNPPWRELYPATPLEGYLSYYLS